MVLSNATITKAGDVWHLGPHRVICGDSTDPTTLARLMRGERAHLMHADPPYGMGKASVGVANDNLYRDKLDTFQSAWWRTCRPHLIDNASAYIWGNAPDLWRWWYLSGLHESETMELRAELVWSKGHSQGMRSPHLTTYATASERMLFLQLGPQTLGNVNSDDFPESLSPLLEYLTGEAAAVGLDSRKVYELTGTRMFSRWFTRSQWSLMRREYYETFQAAFPGHFLRDYEDLRAEYDKLRTAFIELRAAELADLRSYFDNTHDIMSDVWQFPRARYTGDDEYGHPTPKPVALVRRVILSSCPPGGLVLDPFAGAGPTLIAAHETGRTCYAVELLPRWVDVVCRRWQTLTGEMPTRDGVSVDFLGATTTDSPPDE